MPDPGGSKRCAADVFLEQPGGMPRGIGGGAGETGQGDGFGQMCFDEALHPFQENNTVVANRADSCKESASSGLTQEARVF